MNKSFRKHCDKCSVRFTKNTPQLFCDLCDTLKHFRCQYLSKTDAQSLVTSSRSWTCRECILNALPVNAHNQSQSRANKNSPAQFKVQCHSCNGWSYSPANVKLCSWCNNNVHAKCHRLTLGCLKCCENMIPGYHVTSMYILRF